MSIPILKLCPHFTPRPWGGERLKTAFGKPVPAGEKIGESWELSDHPDGPSCVEGGPFDGKRFGELVRDHPEEMIGKTEAPDKYPLLIKYIDAKEDLSIQVHPDDSYTRKHGIPDRGKTECWYILDCEPNAEVIYGLREGVGPEDLRRAIDQKTVPEVVRRIPISPGTFLFVPPGTVHALLGGTLLCEIQQSSNVTYRLWDWDRKPQRELHIEQSLAVIDYSADTKFPPFRLDRTVPEVPQVVNLTSNPYFLVQAVRLGPSQVFERPQPGNGFIVNGVEGTCVMEDREVKPGDTFYVPACVPSVRFRTDDDFCTLLLSRPNKDL